jgi:hypothetical protein
MNIKIASKIRTMTNDKTAVGEKHAIIVNVLEKYFFNGKN